MINVRIEPIGDGPLFYVVRTTCADTGESHNKQVDAKADLFAVVEDLISRYSPKAEAPAAVPLKFSVDQESKTPIAEQIQEAKQNEITAADAATQPEEETPK